MDDSKVLEFLYFNDSSNAILNHINCYIDLKEIILSRFDHVSYYSLYY